MSQHPSFGGKGKIKPKRNVLKRYERVRYLKEKGKWDEEKSILGLPKTLIKE
jgi:small basic protein (TIGR04137 family)